MRAGRRGSPPACAGRLRKATRSASRRARSRRRAVQTTGGTPPPARGRRGARSAEGSAPPLRRAEEHRLRPSRRTVQPGPAQRAPSTSHHAGTRRRRGEGPRPGPAPRPPSRAAPEGSPAASAILEDPRRALRPRGAPWIGERGSSGRTGARVHLERRSARGRRERPRQRPPAATPRRSAAAPPRPIDAASSPSTITPTSVPAATAASRPAARRPAPVLGLAALEQQGRRHGAGEGPMRRIDPDEVEIRGEVRVREGRTDLVREHPALEDRPETARSKPCAPSHRQGRARRGRRHVRTGRLEGTREIVPGNPDGLVAPPASSRPSESSSLLTSSRTSPVPTERREFERRVSTHAFSNSLGLVRKEPRLLDERAHDATGAERRRTRRAPDERQPRALPFARVPRARPRERPRRSLVTM